jgi:hypothetical protein
MVQRCHCAYVSSAMLSHGDMGKPSLASGPRSTSWDHLPVELRLEIFQQALADDLAALDEVACQGFEEPVYHCHPLLHCMLACRAWKDAIYGCPALWRGLYLDATRESPEFIIKTCQHFAARLKSFTSLHLVFYLSYGHSSNQTIAEARACLRRAVFCLSSNVRSVIVQFSSALVPWYQPIEDDRTGAYVDCPNLEVVHIRSAEVCLPVLRPETQGRIHTLYLWNAYGVKHQGRWTGLRNLNFITEVDSSGSIADVLARLMPIGLKRAFVAVHRELHESTFAGVEGMTSALEELALHVQGRNSTEGCGNTIFYPDRTPSFIPFSPNLRVLSLAFSFNNCTAAGQPVFETLDDDDEFQFTYTTPFQFVPAWLLASGCRLSKLSFFIDPYTTMGIWWLRDFVFENSSVQSVSELVLGLHDNRSYDDHSKKWFDVHGGAADGILRKVACHPSYLFIAVDAIEARWSMKTCSRRIILEVLESVECIDYGIRSLMYPDLPEPSSEDWRAGPDIDKGYAMRLKALMREGLSIDCVYRGKILQNWSLFW